MAGTTRTENSYAGMKLEYRWEDKYPKLKCLRTEDPEKFQGAAHERATANLSRFEEMGYRIIELTDKERLDMVGRRDYLLMGKDREQWLADREARAKANKRPEDLVKIDV